MIKNAMLYKLTVDEPLRLNKPEAFADSMANKPVQGQQSTIGFDKHPITKNVISEFNGGFCLTVKEWVKKVDNAAVNACLSDLVIMLEDNNGRSITKKEKEQYKENLIAEQLKTTLPSPKITYVYYLVEPKVLIVDTASSNASETALALLRKALGSLSVEPLCVDETQLLDTFAQCLDDDTRKLTDSLLIGQSISLKGNHSESMNLKNVDMFEDSTIEEILGQIREGGMNIKAIELNSLAFDCTFALTDGNKFKGLKYEIVEVDDGAEYDVNHKWQVETMYSTNVIHSIASTLIDNMTVPEE